jgi:hypothetical protein
MSMSPERYQEIKEAESKATPGPWEVRWIEQTKDGDSPAVGIWGPEHFGYHGDDYHWIVAVTDFDSGRCRCDGVSTGPNAAFIAGARQWLPELLADNERLKTENERHNKTLDEVNRRLLVLESKMDRIAALVASKDVEIARLLRLIHRSTGRRPLADMDRDPMTITAEGLAEIKEYERTVAPLSSRATLRQLIGEVERLNAQPREWEKYTGFLYAHGCFRNPVNPPPSTLTTTASPQSERGPEP